MEPIHKKISLLKLTYPSAPHEVLAFAAGLQLAVEKVDPVKRYSPESVSRAITMALEAYEDTHKKTR
jgi:hypothetical protein